LIESGEKNEKTIQNCQACCVSTGDFLHNGICNDGLSREPEVSETGNRKQSTDHQVE
jgi:hypothetical protein